MGQEKHDNQKAEKAILDFTSALYHPTHVYSRRDLAEGYELLKPHRSAAKDHSPDKGSAVQETGKEIVSLFKRKENYVITPMLMATNIIIFFILLLVDKSLYFDKDFMLSWGANARSATLHGQPWRLLTSCFLHWDLPHLLMNMIALYFIGTYLEPYIGKIKFVIAYVLMGVLANTCSLYWHEHGVAAGASGAIFGLYGILLAL